jgi:hypothetical protein
LKRKLAPAAEEKEKFEAASVVTAEIQSRGWVRHRLHLQ